VLFRSIPGVTQVNEGIVTWAASLGWNNLPLSDIIAKRCPYPVFIEKDVNIATELQTKHRTFP
jgi:predicted NBD/HSP70 family sugar kinase